MIHEELYFLISAIATGVLSGVNPCFWGVIALMFSMSVSEEKPLKPLVGFAVGVILAHDLIFLAFAVDIISTLSLTFGPRSVAYIMILAGVLTIVVEMIVLVFGIRLLYKVYLRLKKVRLSRTRDTRMRRVILSMYKGTVASSLVIGVIFGLLKVPCGVAPFLMWEVSRIYLGASQSVWILPTIICYDLGLLVTMLLAILPFGSEVDVSRKIIHRFGTLIWAAMGVLLISVSGLELYKSLSWAYAALV